MIKESKKELSPKESEEFLNTLKSRFENNQNRHKNIEWQQVQTKLETNPQKLWSLSKMEETDGEPDVVGFDSKSNEYIFYDCSAESPKARRSFCYDSEALQARKANKPKNSAVSMSQ